MADVGLSDQLHDFLLLMSGRVDDDALTSARELVAIAEQDRAAELLVGCLIAGGVPVTPDEHKMVRTLLDEARSDPSLADRLKVRDTWYSPPHRFSSEPDAGIGVGEALRPVMGFLQGVRSVQAVWRVTPAGATPGAVPQRVVLVEIGPDGFAPATAYRMAQALENAGLRAVVEVLREGIDLTEYHVMATTVARPVNLDGQRPQAVNRGDKGRQPKSSHAQPSSPAASASTEVVDVVPEPAEPEAIEYPAAELPSASTEPPMIDPPVDPAALGLVDYRPVAEDKLSDVERDLLRQLHEELAQREQQPKQAGSEWSSDIPQARTGSTGGPTP